MTITEDLLAYFGICKTGLVLHIEYNRNIQILISKSSFIMWQHDLEIHDDIIIRPLWYQLKELVQRKLCVEGNGPVKGATIGFQKISIK